MGLSVLLSFTMAFFMGLVYKIKSAQHFLPHLGEYSTSLKYLMKNYLITCLLIFNMLPVFSQRVPEPPAFSRQLNSEWINQEISAALEENTIPSLSAAVIKNGELIFRRGYGTIKRNSSIKADENTIYQIASLSKMLTGIIANKLVRAGLLELNKSIVVYLPSDLPEKTKEKLQGISVRNLLHHRSGLPRNSMVVERLDGDPMLGGYSEEDLLKDLSLIELAFLPNEAYAYSNLGYALLGYIMERLTNKTYEMLLKEYVSDEFGMPNTGVFISREQNEYLATPYRKEARAIETKPWETGKLTPASGLYSNIIDLSSMMAWQIRDYHQYYDGGAAGPLVLSEFKGARDAEMEFYGFGIIEANTKRGKILGHMGDMDGYASYYLFFPQHKIGVVLLTSSGGSWLSELGNSIFKRLEEEVIKENR